MTKKQFISAGMILLLGAALLAGCPRKKPGDGKRGSAPAQKPAARERSAPTVRVKPPEDAAPSEPGRQAARPEDSGPLIPEDIDEPPKTPDYDYDRQPTGASGKSGSVSGKIMLGERTTQTGNLFVYIPDIDSVNKADPRAVASQVITADRIKGGMAEFTLTGVPPGKHLILALWDISEPHCDLTQSFCAIYEGRDRLGQSDLVEVRPGLKTQGVLITMTSNEMM